MAILLIKLPAFNRSPVPYFLMELRQLRYFIAVAETKSLSRAVERLHIAQPALSQSIKLLEEELATELFARSRRGMELTDSGKTFLQSAKRILNEVDRAREGVRDARDNPSGTVAIAMAPSVSSVLAVPLFETVVQRYPNICLTLDEATALDIRQVFDTGTFDLLVYLHLMGLENVVIEPLVNEHLYLACRHSDARPLPPEIEFNALNDYPLIFPRLPFAVNRMVSGHAEKAGIPVNILPASVSTSTLVKLIKQGTVNSIVPWTLIHDAVRAGEIDASLVVEPRICRDINMISPANRHCSYATLAVMDVIRELTRELNAADVWRGELLI